MASTWRDRAQWRAAGWVAVFGGGALAAAIWFDQPAVPVPPAVSLERWAWQWTPTGRTLTADVRNASDRPLRYAEIRWVLFAGGVQVGTALDNTTDLAPGVVWRATAPVLDAQADSAAVAGMEGR